MSSLSIRVEPKYLSKNECLIKAREILDGGLIDMDEKELAREIYSHTRAFYWFKRFEKIPGPRLIVTRADPIDLQDGGDRWIMRLLFRIVWLICPGSR